MFVLQMSDGTFVRKFDGMNSFVHRPCDATKFLTEESARAGQVGHHRDMGGSGFRGRVVPCRRVEWINERYDCCGNLIWDGSYNEEDNDDS